MSARRMLVVGAHTADLREYCQQRGEQRGNHARKVTGNQEIRYAEACQRIVMNVVEAL